MPLDMLANLPLHGEVAELLVDGEEGALTYTLGTVRHRRWLQHHAVATIFEVKVRQKAPQNPLMLVANCEATLYAVSMKKWSFESCG